MFTERPKIGTYRINTKRVGEAILWFRERKRTDGSYEFWDLWFPTLELAYKLAIKRSRESHQEQQTRH